MALQYYIEEAHLDRDRDQILSVWHRNNLIKPPKSSRYYDWAFEHNPFAQGRCWLIKHAQDGRTIGTAGMAPRRMKIGESTHLVGRAAGFVVDQNFRSLGPALMLEKTMLKDIEHSDFCMLYAMTPQKAATVFKRLKYTSFGTMQHSRKIIGSSDYINNHWSQYPAFARKTIIFLLDLWIKAAASETWRKSKKCRIIRIHEFDERFDDLWSRSAHLYYFTTERSSAFLRWRFSENPRRSNFVCDAIDDGNGGISGYVVYYIEENVAHIIDLFAKDQGYSILDLLAGLARRWRAEGITSAYLSAVGNGRFFDLIGRAGFSSWRARVLPPYELLVSPMTSSCPQGAPGDLEWGFPIADDLD